MTGLFLLALFAGGMIAAAYYAGRLNGSNISQKSKIEEINEAGLDARHIHDRLHFDRSFAGRVRARFRR